MATTFARQVQRRGTAAEWAANSTVVLLDGELGVETDTGRAKLGDGTTQYGSLQYIGHDQGVTFATDAELLAGTVPNKSVAPDTLANNYPRRATGAVQSIINNNWRFNQEVLLNDIATITQSPRSGATGERDIVARADMDAKFAGQISAGSGDVNKAPILKSDGKLDASYIPTGSLPAFRGLFNPVTGVPTLQNVAGGGISPVANNGDYFIASDTGFYNFDTGTPGAGSSVSQGAQIIFETSTTTWSVVNPPGTSFDPGAVRQTPNSNAESTILPGTDGVFNLSLRNRASQTVELLRLLDSAGAQIGGIGSDAVATFKSLIATRTTAVGDVGVDFPTGISYDFVLQSSGWPADGRLITFKESNTSVYQILEAPGVHYTRLFTGTWSGWSQLAPIVSPAFTNIPTAPTAAAGTNTTQLATTEFATRTNQLFAKVVDQKAIAVNGGIATAGSWTIRDLNTIGFNGIGISVASNVFTLPGATKPGTYRIHWRAPAFDVDSHQTRLYDVTGAAALALGESGWSNAINGNDQTYSAGQDVVALTADNDYRIEHRFQTTSTNNNGLGVANTFSSPPVYTQVFIDYQPD